MLYVVRRGKLTVNLGLQARRNSKEPKQDAQQKKREEDQMLVKNNQHLLPLGDQKPMQVGVPDLALGTD